MEQHPIRLTVRDDLRRSRLTVAATTRDPESARGLFRRFTTTALADPDPPAWSEHLLGSHPALVERMAMVEAWREHQRP